MSQRIALMLLLVLVAVPARAQSKFILIDKSVVQLDRAAAAQLEAARAADRRAAELAKQVKTAEAQVVTLMPPRIQQQLEEAKRKAQEAKAAAEKASTVPDAQKQVLLEKVKEFNLAAKEAARQYGTAALAVLVIGLILSLATALAGFMNFSRVAGGLSIVVATLIGIPKVVPISERASYYRILESQSYNLLLESQLRLTTSVEDYNESLRQLKILVTYEAEKFPAGGDVGEVTQSLLTDLNAAKQPPKNPADPSGD